MRLPLLPEKSRGRLTTAQGTNRHSTNKHIGLYNDSSPDTVRIGG